MGSFKSPSLAPSFEDQGYGFEKVAVVSGGQ